MLSTFTKAFSAENIASITDFMRQWTDFMNRLWARVERIDAGVERIENQGSYAREVMERIDERVGRLASGSALTPDLHEIALGMAQNDPRNFQGLGFDAQIDNFIKEQEQYGGHTN